MTVPQQDRVEWPTPVTARLDNGLTVVATTLAHVHSTAISLFVGVGSQDESAAEAGLSHLLEHVLFRGCRGYPDAYAFNSAIERLSVGLDAATYRDTTLFETQTLPESVDEMLALIAAMIGGPEFRDVEVEKKVVVEEIGDQLDGRGRNTDVDELTKRTLFAGSGFGRPIGGTIRTVQGLDRAACERWHARYYGAENMVLSIAGATPAEVAIASARRHFGGIPGGQTNPRRTPALGTELPVFEYLPHDDGKCEVQLSLVMPGPEHPDHLALRVAQQLLDDGTCARLRRRLVDDLGLAYHLGCELETYHGLSLLVVEGTVTATRAVELVDESLAILRSLAREPASPREWERVLRRARFELRTGLDVPGWVASREGAVRMGGPVESLEERYQRLSALSADQVSEVASRHLGEPRLALSVVGRLEPIERATLRRRVRAFAAGVAPAGPAGP